MMRQYETETSVLLATGAHIHFSWTLPAIEYFKKWEYQKEIMTLN